MHLKLISCNVFMREACYCVSRSPHVIDVEFTELGEHVHSGLLRETIQSKIDAADADGKYDAILLLFGLCGNAAVGLQARNTQLVIPRAHDCCTILLGSTKTFRENFEDNPSRPFSSAGYMERGNYFLRTQEEGTAILYGDGYAEMVKQYGEEDAKYVWETMHPEALESHDKKAVFIDLAETTHLGYSEAFRMKAEEEGKEYVRLEGSMRLIAGLVNADWEPADYLVVPPGKKTAGVYDWTEIVRAEG
jgi:hypothetical protein